MSDRPLVPVALAAAAVVLFLVPGLVGPYGPFIDELYYVSCAERLAWGFVDHPPLAPAVLRASRALLGDGMLALRLPAALCGGLVVLLTGLLARRLGARWIGQAIAAGAVVLAPEYQVLFGFFSMNAIEILLWTALGWLLVDVERRAAPRLWLVAGAVAGLALLNKHTFVLLGLALAVGMVATPARRHLRSPWLWGGVAVAAVLLLPNLVWQAAHDWPSLEFYRNANLHKQMRASPLAVVGQQLLFMGPATAPIWIAGLVALLRRREPVGLRHLGIAYLVLLALMIAAREGRPDRIAGAYPLLLAAGGAQLERWSAAAGRRWWRPAVAAWMVAWGVALLPFGVPLFSPAFTARYVAALGVVPQLERGAGKRTALPQWFADRLGWQQLVDEVAAVRARLDAADQARVVFFAPSYGQAGALDWLGKDRGLRPVYATHNSWFLWGPPRGPVDVAIVLGDDPQHLGELFEQVQLADIHDCDGCMPWRDQMPIWIVRRARANIAALWPSWRHFE